MRDRSYRSRVQPVSLDVALDGHRVLHALDETLEVAEAEQLRHEALSLE